MTKRVFILLLDSLGIGAAPDAAKFKDQNANTFLHIAEYCAQGKADAAGVRQGKLNLPNLNRLGLHLAVTACSGGSQVPGFDYTIKPEGIYGYASEMSFGKDTPSGHWEIAGVPVLFEWGYFPKTKPCFPAELVEKFIEKAHVPGILGNCHASGTEIINQYGDEHVKSGKPICYTSADSVFQIAAHEESFGLERLYDLCKIAFSLVQPYKIGRVIARPFLGENGKYYRTDHRKDYSISPPAPTLLDKLASSKGEVIAIGKISDIFAGHGITKKVEAYGNDDLFEATIDAAKTAQGQSLIFTNFVDFDMKYGHRRDVAGYANALEKFDANLSRLREILKPEDVVIITSDHGCDPTVAGSDHTRECIPILVFGQKIKPRDIGRRSTFADIGQSLAQFFGLEPFQYGTSFWEG